MYPWTKHTKYIQQCQCWTALLIFIGKNSSIWHSKQGHRLRSFFFFVFSIYTNLLFYVHVGVDELFSSFFLLFFRIITITNTMTNTESRDFVLIFSGKSLFKIYIAHIKVHRLLATQISSCHARCLI